MCMWYQRITSKETTYKISLLLFSCWKGASPEARLLKILIQWYALCLQRIICFDIPFSRQRTSHRVNWSQKSLVDVPCQIVGSFHTRPVWNDLNESEKHRKRTLYPFTLLVIRCHQYSLYVMSTNFRIRYVYRFNDK